MLKYDPIIDPAHYVADRKIQPIDVIENWQLCHHLACVVKYIARHERKGNPYQDLQKAEWYLTRELSRYTHGFNKCQLKLVDPKIMTCEEVALDWALSPWLYKVLSRLKNMPNKDLKCQNISNALHFLRKEMKTHAG